MYASLLERELRQVEKHDPRGCRPTADGMGCFCRPRRLLEALEAGQPVLVPRWFIRRDQAVLPWPASVRSVEVSTDDVVRPSNSAVSYPGRAVSE